MLPLTRNNFARLLITLAIRVLGKDNDSRATLSKVSLDLVSEVLKARGDMINAIYERED